MKRRGRRSHFPDRVYLAIELGCLVRESTETVEPAGHFMPEKKAVAQTYRLTRVRVSQPAEGVEEQEIRCGACGAVLRVYVSSRRELLRAGCLSTLWVATALAGAGVLIAASDGQLFR